MVGLGMNLEPPISQEKAPALTNGALRTSF